MFSQATSLAVSLEMPNPGAIPWDWKILHFLMHGLRTRRAGAGLFLLARGSVRNEL